MTSITQNLISFDSVLVTYLDNMISMFKETTLHSVEEQSNPDPEFSTVDFPNPEEGASALDLSFQKANSIGAKYILANDPDADRLGVAQKTKDGWKILSGNELGALFGWWIITNYKVRLGC